MNPPEFAMAVGSSSTTTIPRLVRRLGELEVPASGTWQLVPTSHVAIAQRRRDLPIPMRIVAGAFEVHERPEQSTIRMVLDGGEVTFVGSPTRVVADRHGLSEWSVAGILTRGATSDRMTFTVSYHGVFRSRGRSWAWFSGSGAVERPRHRRLRRTPTIERQLVVLDVLLDSPEPPRPVRSVSRAA